MEAFSEILKVILQIANIVVLGYALIKFLNRPHDTLSDKLEALEHKVDELSLKLKEVEDSLKQGNDRFREQDDTNEVLIRSVLALIEFEISYCLTEHKEPSKDLERAKEDLHSYLSKR